MNRIKGTLGLKMRPEPVPKGEVRTEYELSQQVSVLSMENSDHQGTSPSSGEVVGIPYNNEKADTPPKNHRATTKALTAYLKEKYPVAFQEQPRLVLAIGIHRQIELPAGHSKKDLSRMLQWWTKRRSYKAALRAEGAMRHDLDGKPVAPVLPSEVV